MARAAHAGEHPVGQGVGDAVDAKRAQHCRAPGVGLPEALGRSGVSGAGRLLRLDLSDLQVAHDQQLGRPLLDTGTHERGSTLFEHGVRVVGLVELEHGRGHDRLGLLHGHGEGTQWGGRPAEPRRHGIQHRADLAQPGTEGHSGGAVPGGAVAQPGQHRGQGGQPLRRGCEPVGQQPHRARVAGQRRQAGHHEPPNSERDTPASVSR